MNHLYFAFFNWYFSLSGMGLCLYACVPIEKLLDVDMNV